MATKREAASLAFLALLTATAGCGGKIEITASAPPAGDDPSSSRAPGDGTSSSSGRPVSPSQPPSSDSDPGPPPGDPGTPAPGASSPPPFDWLASCPAMPTTPFVHDATLTSVTDAENAMTGRWRGTQTNPWFGTYVVAFRFDADGHYASRTMSGGGPALYWGTDEDTPLKQWRLDHVNADAKGIGEIDVAFAYGNGIYGLPLWQGVIESLVFDAARERMHFVMTRADGYGPIDLDLWRCE